MAALYDYLSPAEVQRQIAVGAVLPPSSLIRGMGNMGMSDEGDPQPQQRQPRKKKRFGIGDVLKNAVPLP